MNKRWRELAEDVVTKALNSKEWTDADHREVDLVKHHEILCRRFEQAIETAVNEERERMVVVMPSFDMEDAAREWSRLAPNRIAQHFYEGALWCRTHAKVGVRE